MGKIKHFSDLEVWQIGKDIVKEVYKITGSFPKEEIYDITSQIKRAVVSVPANIAEGFGRFHYLDKNKFYLNARGSLCELESHILIAKELEFVKQDTKLLFDKIEILSIKLNNLISVTKSKV
ncbi:MAG: four helix bundle protein [bacterium]